MTIASYSDLKGAVANWLARGDLTARIPEFITLAEAKLNRDLRYFGMEKRSSISVNLSSSEPQYISLPDDFQSAIRISLPDETGKPIIEYIDQTRANELATLFSTTGRPIYFTVFGDEMELLPVPNQAYRVEMVYRALLPALSDSNATNWLLDLAPDAYLYGALLEAAPFMLDDERVAIWAAGLKVAMESLNNLTGKQ